MTVLLLGATGFLGAALAERLPHSAPTRAARPRSGSAPPRDDLRWLEARLDATSDDSLDEVLDEAGADVIVNAIAATGASVAEAHALDAVNARFPHRLAAQAGARGMRVIHISTDGVFSGARGSYREDDAPDPADAYGRSKLAGELGAPHLTIRTTFFGRNARGAGLIEWLVRQRGEVAGFADYRFSGLAVSVLADLVAHAATMAPALEGLYHVGGAPTSKYDLLTAAADRLRLDVTVVPVHRRPAIDRTLDTTRFFGAIGRARPSVADSLNALQACPTWSHN